MFHNTSEIGLIPFILEYQISGSWVNSMLVLLCRLLICTRVAGFASLLARVNAATTGWLIIKDS